ncbi:MAG: hypothetical protein R3E32_09480 [Chitinophagales bacterium]
MKNTQLINQLAVSVGKISYLFKSIRKSNAQTNQLEIALLKQYAVELYDQVLALERETNPKADSSKSSINHIKAKIEDQVASIKEEAKELVLPIETSSVEENEAFILDLEKSTTVKEETIEDSVHFEEKEETPAIVSEKEEEILPIESVSKEEIINEMILEVEKDTEAHEVEEDTSDDATSLMDIDTHFFEGDLEVNGQEKMDEYNEDNNAATVIFEKTSANVSENIPIAEKLQRTLAKLKETEENAGVKMHEAKEDDITPLVHSKAEEEENATIIIHSSTEEDDATTIIQPNKREEGATSIINPREVARNFMDEEPEEIEKPVHQPVLTDDNSVRTQILEDIVKSSTPREDDFDFEDDYYSGEDETVALELNDVLARNAGKEKKNGASRKMDVSFNQRFAFINQLFKGDNNAYNKAVDDIATSEGYIQALTYVNLNLVHDYGWDSDDPVVKDFKEVIRKCFLD